MRLHIALGLLTCLISPQIVAEHKTLNCITTALAPTIDGSDNENIWQKAPSVSTTDAVVGIEHTVKCVYDDNNIYLLLKHPDPTKNIEHKRQLWDDKLSRYVPGPKREDTLILKWAMDNHIDDLSLAAELPYRADIWYWKAYRGNSSGFADDKFQVYSNEHMPRAKKLISNSGTRFYLQRRGDEGKSSYKARIVANYEGNETDAYELRKPAGSRADVLAKGEWDAGYWTVEFSRPLYTGNTDDLQMTADGRYNFGVSKFEISGGAVNERLEQPQYNLGDIDNLIELIFIP